MKQKIYNSMSKNKMRNISTVFLILAVAAIALSNANGPAKNNNLVTGAPFNSKRTCTNCHGGGQYGAKISLKLLDSATNQVVTTYSPGHKYKFRIKLTDTSTKILKFGFQTTAANLTGSNINTWGVAPSKTHNILKSGHNYVEHSTPLASGTILIPWTGPVKGTGTVRFYAAGEVVNNNGSTSGDQCKSDSLSIAEGPAALFVSNSISDNQIVKPQYKLTALFTHTGERGLLFSNGGHQQKAQIVIINMEGKLLYSGSTIMNGGDNFISIPVTDKMKGILIVSVITEDGVKTSLKLGLN